MPRGSTWNPKIGGLVRNLSFSFWGYFQVPAVSFPGCTHLFPLKQPFKSFKLRYVQQTSILGTGKNPLVKQCFNFPWPKLGNLSILGGSSQDLDTWCITMVIVSHKDRFVGPLPFRPNFMA